MAAAKTVEVAILEPGKNWVRRTIAWSVASFQEVVGGYFEHLPGIPDAVVYVNEDGLARELPPSAAWIRHGQPVTMISGPILALGPRVGEMESPMTDDAFAKVSLMFRPLPSAGGV